VRLLPNHRFQLAFRRHLLFKACIHGSFAKQGSIITRHLFPQLKPVVLFTQIGLIFRQCWKAGDGKQRNNRKNLFADGASR
jgi:hypothetical protein